MKKLSFLLLSIFLLPLLLVGCEEPTYFSVSWASSSTIYGSVSGTGTVGSATIEEGQTVTLTATALNGSQVVGWVKQNRELLENGEVYSIANTATEDERTAKSTLTFVVNAATQGRYTAVFEEAQQNYVKFSGIMLSTYADTSPVDEIPANSTISDVQIPQISATVSQNNGETVAFEASELSFTDAVATTDAGTQNVTTIARPEKATSVLRLDYSQSQYISAQITVNNASLNFGANLTFKQQDGVWQTGEWPEQAGQYKANYSAAEKQYKIVFPFEVLIQTEAEGGFTNTPLRLYLTLIYENL